MAVVDEDYSDGDEAVDVDDVDDVDDDVYDDVVRRRRKIDLLLYYLFFELDSFDPLHTRGNLINVIFAVFLFYCSQQRDEIMILIEDGTIRSFLSVNVDA